MLFVLKKNSNFFHPFLKKNPFYTLLHQHIIYRFYTLLHQHIIYPFYTFYPNRLLREGFKRKSALNFQCIF